MLSSLATLVDLTILTQIVVLHLALDLVFRVTLGDKRGKTGSRLCVLLAYNITAAAVAAFCASVGCAAWFGGEAATIGGTVQSRLYGESASFARLGAVTAAYEAYNTLVVLVVPEYRTTAFVGHHAATFVLALLSQAPYLHYYGLFFFGVASVSSVPLAVVEVAKCAGLTQLHDRARGVFAAAFLALLRALGDNSEFGGLSSLVTVLLAGPPTPYFSRSPGADSALHAGVFASILKGVVK